MTRRVIFLALIALAVLAFAIAVVDLVAGGFHVRVLGIRISSWEIYKPLAYGEALAFAAFWLHDSRAEPEAASWNGLARRAGAIVIAVAVVFVALMLHYGIRSAGSADPYGYVSE